MWKILFLLFILVIVGLLAVKSVNKSYKRSIKQDKKLYKMNEKMEDQRHKKDLKRQMEKDLYPEKLAMKKASVESNQKIKESLKQSGADYISSGHLRDDIKDIGGIVLNAKTHNVSGTMNSASHFANKRQVQIDAPSHQLPEGSKK